MGVPHCLTRSTAAFSCSTTSVPKLVGTCSGIGGYISVHQQKQRGRPNATHTTTRQDHTADKIRSHFGSSFTARRRYNLRTEAKAQFQTFANTKLPVVLIDGRPREVVLTILQLVQCREQQALWELRQKLGKQRKCKGHRKVDVSAMRAPRKDRTTNKNEAREWPTKPNNAKDTNSELWNLIEAESNKIKATPAIPAALQRGCKDQTNASTDTTSASPQDHSDAVPTTLTRRNQILSDIKKYESMSFQEGSTRASLKTEAVAKLRTELEQVQQDLPQPLPRNIYVRKGKEAKALKQELSNNMEKIQNQMAMKQKLENETNDIKKRMEEAEVERDLAFSQMSQEQSGDTDPEVADQLISEALTSEAAIKPIVDTWMSESAHIVLGDPTQKQAWFTDQLCKHMTQLVFAAIAYKQQNTAVKRTKRRSGLDIDKTVLAEDENMDPNLTNLA